MRRALQCTSVAMFATAVIETALEPARITAAGRLIVGPNVLVSGANRNAAHMEAIACADRSHPSTLLVGSMAARSGHWVTFLYRSADAGRTWTPVLETSGPGSFGDPTCAFGADGRAYYAVLSSRREFSPLRGRRALSGLVYTSPDRGKSWTGEPAALLGGIDRPFLTADESRGADQDLLYVNVLYGSESLKGRDPNKIAPDDPNIETGIGVFVSRDHGKTFALAASPRHGRAGDWATAASNSIVTSTGELVTLFRVMSDRFSRPFLERRAEATMLSVLRSEPGGESSEPVVSIGPVRGEGFSALAVDDNRDGPFNDRIYAVSPNGRSILLFWSADEGRTWSEAKTVRDLGPAAESASADSAFNPAVAVNRHGIVAIAWAEGVRTEAAGKSSWTYRMAASWDGGETFSEPVTVSSDRYDAARSAEASLIGATRRAGHGRQSGSLYIDSFADTGGHTFGLTADSDGIFHPVWTDNRTGVPQLWTASVRAEGLVERPDVRRTVVTPPAAADALVDLTDDTAIEFGDMSISTAKGEIAVAVRIRNGSRASLLAPLHLQIADVQSKLGEIRPIAAGGSGTGDDVWDFSDALPAGGLRRGQATRDKTIVFQLTDGVGPAVARSSGEILTMSFRVRGRLGSRE